MFSCSRNVTGCSLGNGCANSPIFTSFYLLYLSVWLVVKQQPGQQVTAGCWVMCVAHIECGILKKKVVFSVVLVLLVI